MKWHVYIVRCSDNSLYTGITTDPGRRILEHNSGTGAKSIKGKLPVNLVYSELLLNQIEAARREREIKGWSRVKKLGLINGGKKLRLA